MAQVQYMAGHRHTPRRGGARPIGNNPMMQFSGNKGKSGMDPAREAIAMMDTKSKFCKPRRSDGGGDAA